MKIKLNFLYVLLFGLVASSCRGQDSNDCKNRFTEIQKAFYKDDTRQSKLDSILVVLNELKNCAQMRKRIVELKVAVLTTSRRFEDGIRFVDSLDDDDFDFPYQRKTTIYGIRALSYLEKNDSVNIKIIHRKNVEYLEEYMKNNKISDNEFKDIYTIIYTLKLSYLNKNQINKELDILIAKFTDKKTFFEFFKVD